MKRVLSWVCVSTVLVVMGTSLGCGPASGTKQLPPQQKEEISYTIEEVEKLNK